MNFPQINSYEEQAIDIVVSVLNRAMEKLGIRQTLRELARSRNFFASTALVSLNTLKIPFAMTSEQLIIRTIERTWNLTSTFMYILNYKGCSRDETSVYYYFEAIFSQPTISYPIPQATVSVFFRVEEKQIEHHDVRALPLMIFRIEGNKTDFDIRYYKLTEDWILAVIMMKVKLFKRIEQMRLF